MQISRLKNFQEDSSLLQEILEVAQASYVDPTSLLSRACKNNDSIYLLRDNRNKLICFFMTGLHTFDNVTLNYLGWACTRFEFRNRGHILKLFQKSIEYSKSHNMPKLCWLTTSSPTVFRIVHKVWANVCPSIENKYTYDAQQIANKIVRGKRFIADADNPFVIRSASSNTQYSLSDFQKPLGVRKDDAHALFSRLAIDDQAGDRLIMFVKSLKFLVGAALQ